jgi:peptidyl-prolyl cis-trans isomerase B (cyclophilin B)
VCALAIAGCIPKETAKKQKLPVYNQGMEQKELDTIAQKAGEQATREARGEAVAGASWAETAALADIGRVIIETNKGKIVLEMLPGKAPKTVQNFVKLANKGFYNGTKWHMVVPGKIILGGDPLTKDKKLDNDGSGGPGYTIKAEFSDVKNIRGAIGMVRGNGPDTAGSQFYIILSPMPVLDGKTTIFGQVVEGLDILDKIKAYDTVNKIYVEQPSQ